MKTKINKLSHQFMVC